jgi:hypothetical protein
MPDIGGRTTVKAMLMRTLPASPQQLCGMVKVGHSAWPMHSRASFRVAWRPGLLTLRGRSPACERLLQVGDQVVGIFQADREAQQGGW